MAVAEEALTAILTIVAVVVLLYLFVSMYSATLERKREIATMRALGARRGTILGIVLLESGRSHRHRERHRILGDTALLASAPTCWPLARTDHASVPRHRVRAPGLRERRPPGYPGRAAPGGAGDIARRSREPCATFVAVTTDARVRMTLAGWFCTVSALLGLLAYAGEVPR